MLHITLYSSTGELTQTQDVELLRRALQDNHLIWIDMDEPTREELSLLESVFHFHPLSIQDVQETVGVPKIDVYENYTFLVFHRVFYHFDTETCEPREFESFFSQRYLVTIHKSHLSRTFGTARQKVKENPRETLGRGPDYVLVHLLDLAIKDHEPVIEQWQSTLEEIEQTVLKGTKNPILDQILQFKKLVATVRKSLLPEREIIKNLYEKTNFPFISPEVRPYFKSAMDDMNALLHELDGLKEHASSVFEVYAAMLTIKMTESSHQLNFVMQRLTIAATIFLPLTFIVGVYGMNFDHIPEYHWKGFYYLLWIFMISLSVGMVLFFKKKKWL